MTDGWLNVAQAAAQYSVSPSTIRRRIREGSLVGRGSHPVMVSRASLAEQRAAQQEWVSWAEAAQIVRCSEPTIQRLIETGRIRVRRAARGVPSLQRESVERAALEWRAEQKRKKRRRRARRSRVAAPAKSIPPRDGEVWVPTEVAAHALGITPNRVRQLAAAGRLPITKKAGKLWFRRRDVEVAAAARAFLRRTLAVVEDS